MRFLTPRSAPAAAACAAPRREKAKEKAPRDRRALPVYYNEHLSEQKIFMFINIKFCIMCIMYCGLQSATAHARGLSMDSLSMDARGASWFCLCFKMKWKARTSREYGT